MDTYLARLHKRPDHHKKRFALLASSTVTLFIFGIWSIANFGVSTNLGGPETYTASGVQKESEVSPLESIRINLANSFQAFGDLFSNIETDYKEMRDGALDVYGQ